MKTPLGRHLHPYDFDSADLLPLLKQMLLSEKAGDVMFGADLAEHFGDDALTPALVATAIGRNKGGQMQAIYALALNRNEEGLKTLKMLLNSPDSNLSKMAEDAIRNAYTSPGDARGRPLLPGDFDPKYGAPVVKPGPEDLR
jgi:hypothetical protein